MTDGMQGMAARAACWLLLVLRSERVRAYAHGDPLPMMKRIQHSQQRTQWSEVPQRMTPHFGVDTQLTLETLPPGHAHHENYKM